VTCTETAEWRDWSSSACPGHQTFPAASACMMRSDHAHAKLTGSIVASAQASTVAGAHAYMALDVDNSWSFDHFARGFEVSLNEVSDSGDDIEFDVKGVDPAIMNAVRRILISEVPTVAIEHVFFLNNTSIIAVRAFAPVHRASP